MKNTTAARIAMWNTFRADAVQAALAGDLTASRVVDTIDNVLFNLGVSQLS